VAHEIRFGYALNKTLWAAVFKNDSGTWKVYNTGDSWEAWNDANVADYDISLSEGTGGGCYTGTFPEIDAGVYHIIIYEGAVAATDPPVGHGIVHWDGAAEYNMSSLMAYILSDVIGADGDTLEGLSDQIAAAVTEQQKQLNVYGPGE